MLTKNEIRRRLLQNRKPDCEKDSLILENLLSLKEFKEADLLLTYISTESEIDTRALINACFKQGKQVAVPKTDIREIVFHEIKSLSETVKGKFGIREPLKTCKIAQISSNTLCIVPALACNERGFRLGYGRGYYDRFLSGYSGKSAVLCYNENIFEIPVEPHDRASGMIITEGGTLHGR
ncbi:MAG: 5-formyltetrahydrofolate cyclo-ligase [Oscillospiraceae bacterium]|nr:5-formyltetrahydrofolate cyclo-ligase [Oscillospiraceae bacterium]